LGAFLRRLHPTKSVMSEKLGHFRVVEGKAEILRLERRSPLPLLVAVIGGVVLILLWLLRPWHSPSGAVLSALIIVPPVCGLLVAFYLRPWKEVLIFNRAVGDFTREEQYLIRRNSITNLPLDTIESVSAVHRTVRFVDKKGERVEHAYWAALLRSSSGQEVELDGANAQDSVRDFAAAVNRFLADSNPSSL
jgi:alpha-beta hydrolase superfamily lysophospholipase